MIPHDDLPRAALATFEAQTRPQLLKQATRLEGSLGGETERVDPEAFLLLSQENERVSRASTVLAAASLLSNGYSARAISKMLGFSNASNFSKDRLWNQLAPLADRLAMARSAGQTRLPEVEVSVPLTRSTSRTYVFHDVPTGL
ncbi:hypothetical protein PFZ49_12830 [Microbacterium lacticum]|uniref:hypothetical protein n=1 Tax=Microbacterium lacticum TaxID=33885 RepID=UPI003A8C75DC